MPKKPKRSRKQHNLGGVRMSEEMWLRVRDRYGAERELEETFSAWVRRKLAS